jgi:HlyD family secretion protein
MKDKKALAGILAVLLVAAGAAAKLLYFRSDFLYAGTIEATKVDVPARVSSVISGLNVREGDHVTANETLLTLKCEDYRNNAELAKSNFDRAERLFKEGSQPKETYDLMRFRWNDARIKLEWCDIQSPLAGSVLNKYHEAGEMVDPGTRLFTLADLRRPYAYVYVPQPKIAKLALGQKVTGYLPEMGMKAFDGAVVQIGDEAEFTPKNVQTREERTRLVFAVKVEFANPGEILKPGMFIEVRLPEI